MATTEDIARSQMGPEEIPAGSAPVFGDGHPFDPRSTQVILSALAHQRLSDLMQMPFVRGLHLRQPGLLGHLHVQPTDTPGLVHLRADVQWEPSGIVHFDADVRESWLESAAGPQRSSAAVLKALAQVAELPHQRTVRVTVDRDDMGLDVG